MSKKRKSDASQPKPQRLPFETAGELRSRRTQRALARSRRRGRVDAYELYIFAEEEWLLTVEEFVGLVSACGRSALLEELRAEWYMRAAFEPDTFPHRLTWGAWCYQVDTYRNAKESGTLGLL